MHVLGLDAGGMKTVCLLADEQGAVLASARGPGANLQAQGELEVEKTLHDLMEQALADEPFLPDAVCLGIAGVDRPDDAAVMRGIMRRIGYKTRTLVVNDALIALVAAVGIEPGIVIVCGTGSICYGRNDRGQAARAGGWGYILGDEGSGYWIGRRALTAATRHADGRGPATALAAMTLSHFGVRSVPELVHEVHGRDPRRHRISSLAETCSRVRSCRTRPTSCWPQRRQWQSDWKCAGRRSRSSLPAVCFTASRFFASPCCDVCLMWRRDASRRC
jgi:N-acetylglucosamine kinase-like BadF-type ATPase